jgi:thioredoxin reductase (NADPH)
MDEVLQLSILTRGRDPGIWRLQMPGEIRDVAVIGGGPAGLTAGLYLCRARIDVVLAEQQLTGGQAVNSPLIENYPGFPEGISGADLLEKIKAQVDRFELEIKTFSKVVRLTLDGQDKVLEFEEGELRAKAVIVASGRSPRKMGIPGEEEYTGRGISYCATCDAPLFKEKVVMVIGGGDAAVEGPPPRRAARLGLPAGARALRAQDGVLVELAGGRDSR